MRAETLPGRPQAVHVDGLSKEAGHLAGTITAIERQPRRKNRFNVYLDGEFALALHGDIARAAGLRVGDRLRPEQLRDLAGRDAYQTALDTAYRFLAFRPRTESEVRARLRRSKVDATTIDIIAGRLKEQQLVDDGLFARSWADSRSNHSPRSGRMVQWELRRKGVPPEVAEDAAAAVDDVEAAYQAASTRARRMKEPDFETFRKRLGDFLQRRGFGYGVVRRTVDRVWVERGAEESD